MIDKGTILQNTDRVLKETDFAGLGEKKTGKVRDVYIQKDKIILISTDRHSSFDRIVAHVPFKGQVLNQISVFWFNATKDIIPNHVLAVPDPNVLVAKKCSPLPIEFVVRGYITGVTGTSLWTLYNGGQRDFGSFVLPEGMKKNQKLEEPILTPTTKSDQHDRPITPKEIVAEGLVPEKLWAQAAAAALAVFRRGQEIAAQHNLILVDTKYEFGLDENGQLTLIDEVHTPDSSRYWKKENYQKRFEKGLEPENFDKEFFRIWYVKRGYKGDGKPPKMSTELQLKTAVRYMKIYEMITGKTFQGINYPQEKSIIESLSNIL